MERQVRLVVHWKNYVYDDLLVTSLGVRPFEEKTIDRAICETTTCNKKKLIVKIVPKHLNDCDINSYAVSAFICYLKMSSLYRRCATKPLLCYSQSRALPGCDPVIFVRLQEPEKQFLDYRWGERAAHMALERCEVDHAMSWLSTLGGAFSALGEQFQHCAQMAGKISVHQFALALRLGDPLLVARCKLYAALSIIQQGNLRIPRIMIRDIHKFAVHQRDTHLRRMCQGVWAKLKYCYKLRKQRKKQMSF